MNYKQKYYKENRDNIREYHKRYYQEHKEKLKNTTKEYYNNNREKCIEIGKRYYLEKKPIKHYCEICDCHIISTNTSNIRRHERSAKHIRNKEAK